MVINSCIEQWISDSHFHILKFHIEVCIRVNLNNRPMSIVVFHCLLGNIFYLFIFYYLFFIISCFLFFVFLVGFSIEFPPGRHYIKGYSYRVCWTSSFIYLKLYRIPTLEVSMWIIFAAWTSNSVVYCLCIYLFQGSFVS